MLAEAGLQTIVDTTLNQAGDVIRQESLGNGEWIVVEAVMAGAGKSYCNTYPDAWRLALRRIAADGSIDWMANPVFRFQDTRAFPPNVVLPYVEPARRDRRSVGLMSREELAAYLRWMADEIEQDSGVQALLSYDRVAGDDFSVSAVARRLDGHKGPATSVFGQRPIAERVLQAFQKHAA